MLPTGTDSLMSKIKTDNVSEDLHKDKQLFYFSNYPNDSKYYYGANILAIGKMKNETNVVPMKGFLALKS